MDTTSSRAHFMIEAPNRRPSAAPATNPMRVGAPSTTATGWASTAAVALALFAAIGSRPATASSISATTWNSISTQPTPSAGVVSNSNAGTLVQNGNHITVGYSTGLGNGGSGGTQLSGTTNLAVDWNLYNPTNALTTGPGQAVGALRIGFGTDNTGGGNSATNLQTITFSQTVVDPYIYMIYAQGGVVYDFSAYTTTVIDSGGVAFSVPSSSGAATGRTVTGSLNFDSPNAGFILQLTGSFTQIQFNVNASGRTGGPNNPSNSPYASSQITIVAPLSTTSVPGAGLAGLATIGLAGMSRRRRC